MMASSPILRRELLTAARRGWTYRRRCVFAGALLVVLLLFFGLFSYMKGQELSIREMAAVSSYVFGLTAQCQIGLTIWLVPACVAAVIAEEKERRTITNLLTTRLSSAEIVLGKLAAGLVQYSTCVATGLPIMTLLPLLGGVDPRLVVLLYAATASTAFFLAGLSILVSTAARRGARAVGETIGLAALWCGLPVFVHFLVPRAWPWLSPWVYPVNEWILASTPTGVLIATMGAGPAWRFFDSIFRMIGLQLAAGSVLIAWATGRFRAACCEQEGKAPSAGARGLGRLWARPACGENPVLWKELHTARPRGLGDILGALIAVGLVALIGYGTYHFARPAFLELLENGLRPGSFDAERVKFNEFLRHVTSWIEFFTLLIAAGVAAEGVTAERARQTWDGLIATPLDGRAILRAKMIGAAWKVRWGVILLAVLWSVGVLAGALHPLGFAAALVLLGVATWFMVALGTFMSLVSRDTAQASNRALIPVLLMSGSFLVCYLPIRAATILMGAGSAPLINWLSLLSYRDVGEIAIGRDPFSPLEEIGVHTYESPLRVLAACLLGTTGIAAGAGWFSRAAGARFDREAGRAERAAGRPGEEPGALAHQDNRGPWRPWWRKRRRIVFVFGLGPALAAVGIAGFLPSWRAASALRSVIAETDRMCPGWRLDDLDAARARLPETRDAARRVLAADAMLPPRWRGTRATPSVAERDRLDARAGQMPVECLEPAAQQALRAALDAVAPALTEARALVDLPEGRFPVVWAPDGISTRLPHLAMAHGVANLLAYDVLLRAQEQDVEGALTTCRALLNTARSIGDEPALISQLERAEIGALACQQVELALAHGQAPDAILARLQGELESEERQPLFAFGVKGDRALMDRFVASVESGVFTPQQVRRTDFFRSVLLLANTATTTRASLLRFHNRVAEVSRLPIAEQDAALHRLEATVGDMPLAARPFVPSFVRAAATFRRSRARLRCAAAALAAERYRMAHGAWPRALEALGPEYLAQRPSDPSSGKTLRFRRVGAGIVIDSRTEPGQDAGATPSAQPTGTRGDQEFRLWNLPQRHQPSKLTRGRPSPG
jgi:ABC-type transport system involved in multi-copper enzyme maturation permease subunit